MDRLSLKDQDGTLIILYISEEKISSSIPLPAGIVLLPTFLQKAEYILKCANRLTSVEMVIDDNPAVTFFAGQLNISKLLEEMQK